MYVWQLLINQWCYHLSVLSRSVTLRFASKSKYFQKQVFEYTLKAIMVRFATIWSTTVYRVHVETMLIACLSPTDSHAVVQLVSTAHSARTCRTLVWLTVAWMVVFVRNHLRSMHTRMIIFTSLEISKFSSWIQPNFLKLRMQTRVYRSKLSRLDQFLFFVAV